MSLIETIPVELLGILVEHCRRKDLKNLACCSRRCTDLLVPILWKSVHMNLKKILMDNKPCLFERLKHTTKLTLGQYSFPRHNHRVVDDIKRDEIVSALSSKIAHILGFCDPAKVKTLVFANPYESTLGLALDRFPNIQDLKLFDWRGQWDMEDEKIMEEEDDEWEVKEWNVLPPTMKKLQSYSLFIPDINILFALLDRVELKSLKVLLVMNEETILNRIGAEPGLERLTIEFGCLESTIDLTPLGQLKNLTHLTLLCLWSFSGESLLHICCNLHQLRSLAFKHTCTRETLRLEDDNLSELRSLTSLTDLTIQTTKDGSLTSKCLEHISRIPRLRFLTIDAAIFNKEGAHEIRTNASLLNQIPTLQCIFLHQDRRATKVSDVISGITNETMWRMKFTQHDYDYTTMPEDCDGHYTFISPRSEFVSKELQVARICGEDRQILR